MQSNHISNLPIERHYEIQFKLIHCIIIHTNHSQFTNAKSKTYNRFFFLKQTTYYNALHSLNI